MGEHTASLLDELGIGNMSCWPELSVVYASGSFLNCLQPRCQGRKKFRDDRYMKVCRKGLGLNPIGCPLLSKMVPNNPQMKVQ